MEPLTPPVICVCVTRPVLWSAGTGVIQYWPFSGLVAACDVASMDTMLIMKSALMQATRGFRFFFVCVERFIFSMMFVFNFFLSLPEFWNKLSPHLFYGFLKSALTFFAKSSDFMRSRLNKLSKYLCTLGTG